MSSPDAPAGSSVDRSRQTAGGGGQSALQPVPVPTIRWIRWRPRRDWLALAALAAIGLAVYWQLVWRGFVLLSFDAFVYFYPLMAYRDARLLAGELPFWAPNYFLGAPFLANPQTGIFYPPNFLTVWLAPPRAYAWQVFGHALLAAVGAYCCARRVLRVGALGGVAAGLTFAFGGFAQSMVGHINQLQAAGWLPWAVLCAEVAVATGSRRAVAALGVVLALQLLAGHAQQSYMTIAFLGVWLGVRCALSLWRRYAAGPFSLWRTHASSPLSLWERVGVRAARLPPAPFTSSNPHPSPLPEGEGETSALPGDEGARVVLRPVLVLAVAGVLAGLLAAPQLLPMAELTARGIRAGGMTYREAAAFSLPPFVLPSSLLPVFVSAGQPGSEWLGYVGVVGLVLAGVGLVGGHRPSRAWLLGPIVLAAVLLALGQFGPLYPLLYPVVPGLGLFRVPARWLFVASFALALLAAVGADHLRRADLADANRVLRRLGALLAVLVGPFALYAALGRQPALALPAAESMLAWLGLAIAALALTALGLVGWRPAPFALVGLLAAELIAASLPLDANNVGPPEAYSSLRPIEAHLLAAMADLPGGPYRTLAITDSSFDPGDLELLRAQVEGVIPAENVAAWVAVVKHKDTLTPNLPLRFGIPSIDGYDGGLLPLHSYVGMKELFPLRAANLNDGRLGIQLDRLPPPDLLSWLNVRWIVMDRHRDVWIDGIYYDRAVETDVPAGGALVLEGVPATARATAIGLWLSALGPVGPDTPLGEVEVVGRDAMTRRVALWAGPTGAGPGEPQLVRSALGGSIDAARIVVRPAAGGPGLRLAGVTLVDEELKVDWPVPAAPGLRFSALGDVKVYENARARPRAFLVHGVEPVGSDDEARARLAAGLDTAATAAIVDATDADRAARPPGRLDPGEAVDVVAYHPERVELRASLARPGVLVLTDADYPGWRAEVDGRPVAIRRANGGLRALLLDPGDHTIVFSFRPTLLLPGLTLFAFGLLGLAVCLTGWARTTQMSATEPSG